MPVGPLCIRPNDEFDVILDWAAIHQVSAIDISVIFDQSFFSGWNDLVAAVFFVTFLIVAFLPLDIFRNIVWIDSDPSNPVSPITGFYV